MAARTVRASEKGFFTLNGWGTGGGVWGNSRGTIYVTDTDLICAHSRTVSLLTDLPRSVLNRLLLGIPGFLNPSDLHEVSIEDASERESIWLPLEDVTGVSVSGTGLTSDPEISVSTVNRNSVDIKLGTSVRQSKRYSDRMEEFAEEIEAAALDAGADLRTAEA